MSITFVAAGAASSGTAGISPAIPAGVVAGDLLILVAECSGGETVSTPSGWNDGPAVSNSAVTSALYVFTRTATGSDSAPTVADPGDHVIAQIMAWRGVDTSGPYGGLGTDRVTTDGTGTSVSVNATAGSTGAANSVVLLFVDNPTDTATSQGSAYANASLSSITERMDSNTTQGNGGGFSVASGDRATVGNYGTWTMTLASSASWAAIVASLVPVAIVSGDGSSAGAVTVTGIGTGIFGGAAASAATTAVAGVGASIAAGIGSIAGQVIATAVGSTANSIAAGAGSSAVTTTVVGVGASTAAAAGASAAQATAIAVGAASDSAVGTIAGQVTVIGVGSSTAQGVGAASSSVIVDGRSAYFIEAVGNAAANVVVLGVSGNENAASFTSSGGIGTGWAPKTLSQLKREAERARRKARKKVLVALDRQGMLSERPAEIKAYVDSASFDVLAPLADDMFINTAEQAAITAQLMRLAFEYARQVADDEDLMLLAA